MHLGTVCTSFVFINSGTHRRSRLRPLGRQDLTHVALGNILASRSSLLAWLAWGMGAFFVLEQPRSSLMVEIPSWQALIAYFANNVQRPVKLNPVNMGAFRAPTVKPTALYSSEDLGFLMNIPLPPKHLRPAVDKPVAKRQLGQSMQLCTHVGHTHVYILRLKSKV